MSDKFLEHLKQDEKNAKWYMFITAILIFPLVITIPAYILAREKRIAYEKSL